MSKELKSFLGLCLQRDPQSRPSAKNLLQHSFFNIQNKKVSDTNLGLNLEISRNSSKSPAKIESSKKTQSSILTISSIEKMKDLKLIKGINLNIEEQKLKDIQEEQSKNETTLKNKNVINILASSENNGAAFFSISMTISQQSDLPNEPQDSAYNKESKIIPLNLTEKDISVNSKNKILTKISSDTKKIDNELAISKEENNSKNFKGDESEKFNNFIDQSSITIKNFLENCPKNQCESVEFENKEKYINTLDFRNEDIQILKNQFMSKR